MKICIDPGHGGKDPGAISNGLKEKNIALGIAITLANKLREIRIMAGLSQEQLAEKLGVATKTVSYWENGHNAVTFNKIPLIANALGVPVYKLFVFGDILGSDDEIQDLLNEKLYHDDFEWNKKERVAFGS